MSNTQLAELYAVVGLQLFVNVDFARVFVHFYRRRHKEPLIERRQSDCLF